MGTSRVCVVVSTGAVVILAAAVFSRAGDLNPPAGPPAPTMRTLTEVYDAVSGLGPSGNCGPAVAGESRLMGRMTISAPQLPPDGASFDVVGLTQASSRPDSHHGSVTLGALVIRKNIDAASPFFMQALWTNLLLQSAMVTLFDDTGGYYTIRLTGPYVLGVSTEVQAVCGGGYVHVESVTFGFTGITWVHVPSGNSFSIAP